MASGISIHSSYSRIAKYLPAPFILAALFSSSPTPARTKPCPDRGGLPGHQMGSGACTGNFHSVVSLPSAMGLGLHHDSLLTAQTTQSQMGFGKGFALSAERWFVLGGDSSGILYTGIGQQLKYIKATNGFWTTDPTESSSWLSFSGGTLAEVGLDGVGYQYQKQTGGPYAGQFLIAAISDRNGHNTTYVRNSSGQITSISYPSGRSVNIHYSNGLADKISDPAGNDYTLSYVGSGYLKTIGYPDRSSVSFNYEQFQIKELIDSKGRKTKLTLDFSNGVVKKVTDPDSRDTIYTYTANSVDILSPFSETVEEFNDQGQIIKQTTDGLVSSWERDDSGRITRQTDSLNNVTKYEYGNSLFPKKVTYPDGSTEEIVFKSVGISSPLVDSSPFDGAAPFQISFLISGTRRATNYYLNYEQLGIPSEIKHTVNQVSEVTKYEYNSAGFFSKITALGKPTTYGYDTGGNLTQITDWKNAPLYSASYDDKGRPNQESDALGLSTQNSYNSTSGWLSKITYPNGSFQTFDFDSLGRITSVSGSDGKRQTFTYANALQVSGTSRAYSNESVSSTVTYSPDGSSSVDSKWNIGNQSVTHDRVEFDSKNKFQKMVHIE